MRSAPAKWSSRKSRSSSPSPPAGRRTRPGVARHAVVDVDDRVARLEAFQQVARHDPAERPRPADADGAEQLPVGDQDKLLGAAGEPAVEAALDERQAARWRSLGEARHGRRRLVGLFEHLRQARRLVGGQDHPSPSARQRASWCRGRRAAPEGAPVRASRTDCRRAARRRRRSPSAARACGPRGSAAATRGARVGRRPAPW